jgi:selenide, water dikinase
LSSTNSAEDGAVYLLDDDTALIYTVDFFTPVVDDPRLFGRIAAVNAMSDIYAMGGSPKLALNLAAFPVRKYRLLELEEILAGAAEAAAEAGCIIAGGHTIDDNEPKFGLTVIGFAHPKKLLTKSGAKPGNVIILTKPLGTGIFATAIKNEKADMELAAPVIASMSALNRTASEAAVAAGLKGATDITGYGLLGHLLEMCAASGTGAEIDFDNIPFFDGVKELAEKGFVPGGTRANLSFVSSSLKASENISETEMLMAADAQTSGGLLLAVPEEKLNAVRKFLDSNNQFYKEIGRFTDQKENISLIK